MSSARELFIYYRVTPADASAVQERVMALQQQLRTLHPGLIARLLTRTGAADGWHTWMETYAFPTAPEGVSWELQQQIEQLAGSVFGSLKPAARHVEVFTPCA